MKHNSIENDFTEEDNIKIFGHKIVLTLQSPGTILCTITFNTQKFYVHMKLRTTNSYYFLVQNQLIGLYNRGMCFLRGTNCLCFELMSVFKKIISQ